MLKNSTHFSFFTGSTGNPKGVMTSFKAMRDTTEGLVKVLKVTSNDRYLSYLPVAHGMERWIGEVSVCLVAVVQR
jgi:long-chain acyl-CoA synthetase